MRGNITLAFILCFAATTGFAQSHLNGKWMTDRQTEPSMLGERRQIVQLDLAIENDKASGSLALGGLGGTFYTFKDGKLDGNKLQFRTTTTSGGQTASTTWHVELVDENTVTIARERPDFSIMPGNVLQLASVLGKGVQPAAPVQVPTNTEPSLLSGIVQDPSKARIPGVAVTAIDVDTGASFRTTTNESGHYSFPIVTPGKYSIAASFAGFKTQTIGDFIIGNARLTQDFTLEFGTVQVLDPPLAVLHRGK